LPLPPPPDHEDLDPRDWPDARAQAHRMLDDLFDHLERLREGPVWRPIPEQVRQAVRQPLPRRPTPLAQVHEEFMRLVLPYSVGNLHPGFMGWVHGGGNVAGMLGEMLAAGLNANLGGRDQMPVELERQILRWLAPLFGMSGQAGGLFVTGSSMANFMAVLVARSAALGSEVRNKGLACARRQLAGYASTAVHGCVVRAMEMAGMGSEALRLVPVDGEGRMDLAALAAAVAGDRSAGRQPFLVVGTAGTVDTGAVDDLEGIADLAAEHRLWFHVDGAYGALALLAPALAPRLAGIRRADSVALDFHKWGQVPYDAGYFLARDGELQRRTFASEAAYLRRSDRGLAAGTPWPCDLGPDLSRGFRALKVWFTLKVHGTDRLGEIIGHTCELARYLQDRVLQEPRLELLAPAHLNIVCFRLRGDDSGRRSAEAVTRLHESGLAAPSTTVLGGRLAIRAAIVNHRTQPRDIDRLLDALLPDLA